MTASATVDRRRGLLSTLRDVYHENTRFDFIGRTWLWALISGAAVAVSLATLVLSGLNLGIDFTGGTSLTVKVTGAAPTISDVRDELRPLGLADAKVLLQENQANGERSVVVQVSDLSTAKEADLTASLEQFGDITRRAEVSASWGDRVSSKALLALVVFFVLIASYLTFRFEWKMAVAAIMAVVHDIAITVGVYAVSGFEVTPATVIAFLTILGFSLYDTVVVFDKISENTPSVGADRGDSYSSMVNRSMNAVLMRSLNTSFVALLPVASLLVVGSGVLGAVSLRDFALALFVGLLAGAYSSIFVATPILAWMKEREPRYRALRERSAAQLARGDVGPATTAAPPTSDPSRVSDAPAAPRPPGAVAPRPRQQRRKRRR
ncbi:MAG: protein translocase subunit SecF [Acidimicrobiia bacterium]